MKIRDKDDKFLHNAIEKVDSRISDTCKKEIRKEKKRLKKQASKKIRARENRALTDEL